jgi:hypothetical protein
MRPMRTREEFERVVRLAVSGRNHSQIARETGISRTTIRTWLRDGPPVGRNPRNGSGLSDPFPWLTRHAYVYLLGLYLGDGHLAEMKRGVYMLRIFLDAKYPRVVAEAATAVSLVNPSGGVGVQSPKHAQMKVVCGYSKQWPTLFPQHGPGMKHTRRIELELWQREVCGRFPHRLLRGLIHSDGCRSINTIRHARRTYRYPRYQFSNRSDDIRAIFCEYCDQLGIEWRQMNRWTISVARRASVARLDELVGPKR